MRNGSEHLASRLPLSMQDSSIRRFSAAANYYIITYIVILIVMLTAVKFGHKDKISFIKKFFPNL